jgi:hypothetical protein
MGALQHGEADRDHDCHRKIAVSPAQHGATRPRMRLAPILNEPSIRNRQHAQHSVRSISFHRQTEIPQKPYSFDALDVAFCFSRPH